MKNQEELQDAADRAFELLERKSPHQLAVEMVSMEDRLEAAIDACARMQEQRDQLQSRLKATMDALSGAVEAAVAEGRSYRPWRYQAEELLGLHQLPIHYMRDNHTFKRLSDDVETAIEEIVTELDAGFTSGMLCSKRPGFVNIGTNYRQPREEFLSACRKALLAAATKPEGAA